MGKQQLQMDLLYLQEQLNNLKSNNELQDNDNFRQHINDKKEKYNDVMEKFIKLGRIIIGNNSATYDEIENWIIGHAAQQIKEFLKKEYSVMEEAMTSLDTIGERYLCFLEVLIIQSLSHLETKEISFLKMFTPEEIERYKGFQNYLRNNTHNSNKRP